MTVPFIWNSFSYPVLTIRLDPTSHQNPLPLGSIHYVLFYFSFFLVSSIHVFLESNTHIVLSKYLLTLLLNSCLAEVHKTVALILEFMDQ